MSEFDLKWYDERLEAYVDGELNEDDRRRMDAYLSDSGAAARQLRIARMVKAKLADMPWEVCPPDVTRAVLVAARKDARSSILRRTLDEIRSAWATILRPSLSVGVLVAAILVGTLVGRKDVEEIAATPQEIQRALDEAKWTLAFLAELGRKTGQSIRKEVIEERVAQPMQKAITTAFDDDTTAH